MVGVSQPCFESLRHFLHHLFFFFPAGSVGEVKKWTEFSGKAIEIDFYVDGRLDKLKRREEVLGKEINEYFEGRTDQLVYRSGVCVCVCVCVF